MRLGQPTFRPDSKEDQHTFFSSCGSIHCFKPLRETDGNQNATLSSVRVVMSVRMCCCVEAPR